MRRVLSLLATLLMMFTVSQASALGASTVQAPGGVITGISAQAALSSLTTRDETALSAFVQGTGSFNPAVAWRIVSGGGSLSATTGAKVRYTAPATSGTVVLEAAAVGDPSQTSRITLTINGGPVEVVSAAPFIRKAANHFDLAGKTLRFTPHADGGYKLQVLPLAFNEERGTLLTPETADGEWPAYGWKVALPFAFPFGGSNWSEVFVNYYGNISFGKPEAASWQERYPFPDGTMTSVAASIDARAAAAKEQMIAALWAPYDERKTGPIRASSSAEGLVVTWEVEREGGGIGPAPPGGTNLFQAKLYPDGRIDLSYQSVPEKDGIVGLFPGSADGGTRLDRVIDPADAPHGSVEVLAIEAQAAGTQVRFDLEMQEAVPTSVASGTLEHRLQFEVDGQPCMVRTVITQSAEAVSDCGFTPGFQVKGSRVSLFLPRSALAGRKVTWSADVVWWGFEGRFDQVSLQERRSLTVQPYALDLSAGSAQLTGNAYEIFHYPVVVRRPEEILPTLYRSFPADDDLAVLFYDFRVDALYSEGSATGRVGREIKGIGQGSEHVRSSASMGSNRLQSSFAAVWLGAPMLAESYEGEGLRTHSYGRALFWIAHELVHSWTAQLKFRNPITGKDESLAGVWCGCHWREELHAPALAPVSAAYTERPYAEASLMANATGSFWEEQPDGTFLGRERPFHAPVGLSALDLYAMGLLAPEEVPDTFLLQQIVDLGSNRVRASKVPVRIVDIIAASGRRDPDHRSAPKQFTLGVYLLHEPGRQVDPAMLARAKDLSAAIADYFHRATGGRMHVDT